MYKHFDKCLVDLIFNKDQNNGGLSTRCPGHSCSGHCDHRLDIHRNISVFKQSSCFLCNNMLQNSLVPLNRLRCSVLHLNQFVPLSAALICFAIGKLFITE